MTLNAAPARILYPIERMGVTSEESPVNTDQTQTLEGLDLKERLKYGPSPVRLVAGQPEAVWRILLKETGWWL